MALAAVDDLEARVGSTLVTERAQALLDDASARFRSYTGQQFTLAETTDRLRVRKGRVRLPQRPVVEVTEVSDLNGNAVTYSLVGDSLICNSGVPDEWSFEPRRNGLLYVDVTYEHGYDTIPDDVIAVVCQIAGRAYGSASTEAGTTSESLGAYSYTMGGAAAAGPLGMLPDERAVGDRYRRELGVSVYGP